MINETTINIMIKHQMKKSNVTLCLHKSKYTKSANKYI